jgi:hypothetical protein
LNYIRYSPGASFRELLTAAINELSRIGYVNPSEIDEWRMVLRAAAERDLGPVDAIDSDVRAGFERLLNRFVDGVKLPERVEGVGRFTKHTVKPRLWGELDRRIKASADLIKMHRREAIDRTMKRFVGWVTALPPGGDDTIDRRETKTKLGQDLVNYRYHRRFVDTDQGHKLIANVANIVAVDAGAIAGTWHSHGATDPSYDARADHLDLDGKTYLIRDSWAHRQGLVKPVNGYTDDIVAPAQKPNCRCWLTYITSPRRLPDAFLTRKGQEWIEESRRQASVIMTGAA